MKCFIRSSGRKHLRTVFSATTALSLLLLTFSLLAADQAPPALKDALKGSFLIGAALNPAEFTESDARDAAIVKAQFDSISPENVLKWEMVHPEPGRYDFDLPDKYVAFGGKNHMFIIGHTLVWHHQTPKWVFEDAKGNPVDREALLKRMREHIQAVVGRYKGRVHGWDVVNEALDDDGTLRQTPWLKIIGEDYIAKAFEFAHEADPKAELYYNDFSLENEAKRNGAIELIRKLRAHGAPVTGVGLQGHYKIDWPSVDQLDAAIAAFAKLGVKVMITELDIDVLPPAMQYRGADISANVELQPKLNPYTSGLPDSVQQALANRYNELFRVFLKHRGVLSRVTFWGVTDAGSWLNNWPVRGRTSYPLLFDRDGRPKPAFYAVIKAARGASAAK
ncbi:MAG: endo-1,4-beta-xylanase [Terriglobia bacterium]|jgi:endo-1,4-beta-xylanase